MKPVIHVGIDVGSTTVKVAALSPYLKLLFGRYQRHMSDIRSATMSLLKELQEKFSGYRITASISGSGGMGLAKLMGLPFCQEILAETKAVETFHPDTDVIIELGGEDEKITYLRNGVDQRMNGACAGGTGAFIDRMASLLSVDAAGLGQLAAKAGRIYPIASRCGVFAKTDIQALLNEGVSHEDIALSVFQSVVNQTISGLTCGRPVHGKVAFLGGPLTFQPMLRERFQKTLDIADEDMIVPEHGELYVAMGAALSGRHDRPMDLDSWLAKVEEAKDVDLGTSKTLPPLFANEEEYREFTERHSRFHAPRGDISKAKGSLWLGIDAGSTTIKAVLLDKEGRILYEYYSSNKGTPLAGARKILSDLYSKLPKGAVIAGAGVTGYGEELIKRALQADVGEVETMAHYRGARHFLPDVTTILDIGGQDMKCIKIKNQTVDSVQLNEACSSGCGSFIETFAKSLNYSITDFAQEALFAEHPIDLGTRCTVFMNSSVKQAQKDGATIEDISAGLSLSVVKNALYKVIRASSPDELGKRVVVQGGTFLNDAVLRAFEQEMGVEVVRPNIAGLMGAYGAALYAKKKSKGVGKSTITDKKGLDEFVHEIKVANCGMCNNNCRLTINSFGKGRKFIAGNRCERPITKKAPANDMNMYAYKLNLIDSYKPVEGIRGKLGIPMALNMYELYPFWYRFFTELKFEVFHSPYSTRKLYQRGQQTIPSDTVCFPAKLVHGHIQTLIDMGAETIFYPCLSYNFDEHLGDNHYNCPVVAYYPEVIKNNMKDIRKVHFIKEYFGIHRPNDFPKKAYERLSFHFPDLTLNEVRNAAKLAYQEQENYRKKVIDKGNEIIAKAEKEGKKIFVLAGRPYHIDPEINHGIDRLISGFDVAIVSEDVVSPRVEHFRTHVLNQWTYHARLYAAAKYVTTRKDMELVQLVSFGCGVDAITTDEVREILESKNKIYTQIKIDEITNLGAVKIRIRSLLAALEND